MILNTALITTKHVDFILAEQTTECLQAVVEQTAE